MNGGETSPAPIQRAETEGVRKEVLTRFGLAHEGLRLMSLRISAWRNLSSLFALIS
jgi:hypothetical protein